MTEARNSNRFVAGGARVYANALRKRFHVELDQLKSRLKAAGTEPERTELQRQIARLTEEYRQKPRAIDRSLF